MAHGIEVYNSSGSVILKSDSKIVRIVMNVTYPAIAWGGTWTYNNANITTECIGLVFSGMFSIRCFAGYLTITAIPFRAGRTGNATNGGTFRLIKG